MSRQQRACSGDTDIRVGSALHVKAAGEKQTSSVIIGGRLWAVRTGHVVALSVFSPILLTLFFFNANLQAGL